MRPIPPRLSSAALLILLFVATARAELVVTELAPHGGAASTDLRVGDRILEWQHELGSGRLDTPLDLELLEIEIMPLGTLILIGERDGESLRWELPPIRCGITATSDGPDTPEHRAWISLEAARASLLAGERETSEDEWTKAIAEPDEAGGVRSALLHLDWSLALEGARDRESARSSAEAGLEKLRAATPDHPLLEAQLLERIGTLARRLSDLDAAESLMGEALALRELQAPDSYAVAESYYDLHLCAFTRGQLDQAAELGARSLAIYETLPHSEYLVAQTRSKLGRVSLTRSEHELARTQFESSLEVFLRMDPDGPDVGESYTNLGMLARREGDLALAEERFLAALAIYEPIEPDGPAVAMLMNNLGVVAFDRGDLFGAEHYIGRALELREEHDPESMVVAMYLNNVAGLAFERGDLAKAEQLYLRALTIREELAPDGLDTALSNENLGSVCFERGDLERSAQYFDRCLAMTHELAPGSTDEARILSNRAKLASRQGDLEMALELHEQSLAIRSELGPGGIEHASSLAGIADVNRQLGHYEIATQQLEEAVAISEAKAPSGLQTAAYYAMLGAVHRESGDPQLALEYAESALRLRQALIPGSYWEAVSWHDIGKAHRAAGDWPPALGAFVQATELMDQQDLRVGEIESSRMRFLARHADLYRDCIDARVQVGELDGAIEDLERSRARSFLTMLGQRDLQFTADLPPELLAQRRRNRTEYDRTLSELSDLSPDEDPENAKRLSGQLADLSEERERIATEVRRLSPQLDALERPRPLSAQEILERIPRDTILLSYSIGSERGHGFLLRGATDDEPGEISSFVLEMGRDELETMVRGYRETLQNKESYEAEAAALYEILIEPAADRIATEEHLLLSPDGPLHLLPFAALTLPESLAPSRFLVEWRPLHFSSSVAVYTELTQRAPTTDEAPIVVFADPPQISMNSSTTRGMAGSARSLGRLEFAREEASAIESLYGSSRTTLYLGAEASEAGVKNLSGELAFAHFACHGLADQVDPLNSALILGETTSIEDPDENGFLQSWEVLESVRFDADLVTLSACETALGVDMGGEGLVSLVRSFQYAGASSVLASLWQVADRPTSRLMEDFYRALRRGESKDAALRSAQLASLSQSAENTGSSTQRGVGGLSDGEGDATHPFYWAAFQLYGNPSRPR